MRGKLNGEDIHVFVNHWPSRRDGGVETEYKRVKASETIIRFMAGLEETYSNPNYIIMGDFNDDPTSKSVKEIVVKDDFYNPMEFLLDKEKMGSLTYDGKWNLFDQIIFSKNFLDKTQGNLHFKHAEVFNKQWLKIYKGKLKGIPFRTYIGKWYQGGFSDHFPVYAFLEKED